MHRRFRPTASNGGDAAWPKTSCVFYVVFCCSVVLYVCDVSAVLVTVPNPILVVIMLIIRLEVFFYFLPSVSVEAVAAATATATTVVELLV